MNTMLLQQAKERINNVPMLINVISRRVRQLNAGQRPMVKPDRGMSNMDLALAEVAEGKLTAELTFTPTTQSEGDNLIQL